MKRKEREGYLKKNTSSFFDSSFTRMKSTFTGQVCSHDSIVLHAATKQNPMDDLLANIANMMSGIKTNLFERSDSSALSVCSISSRAS
jgi:hypothetical protein